MITVGKSKFGLGAFAADSYKKGETICKFTGPVLSFKETVALGKNQCYPLQIGIDKYVNLDEPFKFINHSCNPNCGLIESLTLIALRDITKEEEIQYDYSTTMYERCWTMNCECGSDRCRKLIDDFDKLPKLIQKEYIQISIVQPFILPLIK